MKGSVRDAQIPLKSQGVPCNFVLHPETQAFELPQCSWQSSSRPALSVAELPSFNAFFKRL